MTQPDESRPERLDRHAMDRAWKRRVEAAAPPWLHAEVARRMAERLAIVRQVPDPVLDWWGEFAASGEPLAQAYPSARVVRVLRPVVSTVDGDAAASPGRAFSSSPAADSTPRPSPEHAPAGSVASSDRGSPSRARTSVPAWRRWLGLAPAPRVEVAQSEVEPAQARLVWANMGLHWAPDAPALMRAWHAALAVDGFLMFSTLGPGTLQSLRGLYGRHGWGTPYPPWTDMHDLGDMLVEAGFADPVMDQETLRLSWSAPEAALAELRALGANTDRARFAGLRTPQWRARLHEALRSRADAQGRIVLEFEVVYGHAFKPPPRLRVAAQTTIGLDDMRARLRHGTSRPES